MSADDPKPRLGRPRGLARFLEAGQAFGAELARGGAGIERPTSIAASAEAELDRLEPRLAAPIPLWKREADVMMLRGLARTLAELEPGPEVERALERIAHARARLRAQDQAEIGPLTARFERGEYGVEDLKKELAARPRFEWDPFVERLLGIDEVPSPEAARAPEMVHYLASHLDVIADLVTELGPSDVLFDLGAGLGKVTMLASWLSGARARGVELDPAYVRHAAARARALGLHRVELIAADAREVDYGEGTVFFFFDPFRGEVLESVLAKIEVVARLHPVRVATKGRSTEPIHQRPWLAPLRQHASGLAIYQSRPSAP